jgi:serine phosphatase RsbU (regulator of sigma subunit)
LARISGVLVEVHLEAHGTVVVNVDDDPAKRYTVTRILHRAGYKVIEAATGREALIAVEQKPALVMLDIGLPDMSGYEVCQIIKKDNRTSSIPVLHMSASFTESADKALGLNAGADGYLTHPVETNVLLATVRSLIRMREAEAMARASAAALDEAYREQKRIAETLQRSLLINIPEDTFAGITVATFYEAAWVETSVGGDFYDIFRVPGDRIALVAGDATGKGLAAATRTAEAKFALRAYMHEHADPAEALSRLNWYLCDAYGLAHDSDSVVAIAVGLVDVAAGDVRFASAGAEPPLILGPGKGSRLAHTEGRPVGAFREAEYSNVLMPFAHGDTILMATDGITEARRGKEFLSYEGMVALAAEHLTGSRPVYEEGQAMLDSAREFASGKFQDDVCIVLARHT